MLESEQAQKLVERVAEAPEVRSAITSQGLGLLEDVRRTARRAARGSTTRSSAVRRRSAAAARAERPIYAGGATRLLAIGFDALVLSGILLLISAALWRCLNALFSLDGDPTAATIAFGDPPGGPRRASISGCSGSSPSAPLA